MVLTLYHAPGSAPCHNVRLGARALGLTLELKLVDLATKEQLQPEYLKMNPLHTVPTLDDGGFYLADSHGILQYLVNTYGKDNDPLYPKDNKQRALVDQRLLFNLSVLYKGFSDAYYPIFIAQKKPAAKDLARFDETLGFLETYLSQTAYSALDHLTIADIAIAVTLETARAVFGHDYSKFPKVVKYFEKCQAEIADFKEVNEPGNQGFKVWIDEALKVAT